MRDVRRSLQNLDSVLLATEEGMESPDSRESVRAIRDKMQPAFGAFDGIPEHTYPPVVEGILQSRRPSLTVAIVPTVLTSIFVTVLYFTAVFLVVLSRVSRLGLKPIAWLRPTTFVEKRPGTALALLIVLYVGLPYTLVRAVAG